MECELANEALSHTLRMIGDQKRKNQRRLLLFRDSKFKKFKVIGRRRNRIRNRFDILRKLRDMDDEFFKKYFRMDRATFELLKISIEDKIRKNETKARNSSKYEISPVIKLSLALRFLSGGSYLDLAFGFNVSHKHVMTYVWEVLEAIDSTMNNINFPIDDEEKLRKIEDGFNAISGGCFRGTVAAGDGVVFRMHKPPKDAVDGDVASFFTRKGFYAYGMQAFVDSSCRFLNISMKMASSTHDSTAYIVSDLAYAIQEKKLPRWAHIVLDEAYPNRDQELSPYRGRSLDHWKDSFNYHLSLHRQVVERAFGLLIQRWGVFWRPLRVSFHRIPLLIRVCCKLHNYLIDRNGSNDRIEIARGDVQTGDMASPLFTDGIPAASGRGRRTDLEENHRRSAITSRLKNLGILRPKHSSFSRVGRI